MRRPAFCGEEQATANTLAERARHRSSARLGCGSMRTPVQPSCSRCQVCDSCCGRLAPTSTKKPDRAPPKNSRTSFCSRPSGKVVRTAFSVRSEEHTSELQSLRHLVCRLLLEKKKKKNHNSQRPTNQRHKS